MSTDLDRRNFLFRSGATLGGLLASPRLGVLAAVGGAIAASEAAVQAGVKTETIEERLLLRSGEPMNTRGQPFGHGIDAAVLVQAPAAKQGERVFLVAGHGQCRPHEEERLRLKSVGVSVVELQLDSRQKTWRHLVSSHHNRRWDGETAIPLEGARLGAEGKLFRHQAVLPGTGEIAAMAALPWQTALAAERDGWLAEINPVTGFAVKRFSIGRISAVALAVVAEPGQRVCVYALGRHLYKFVSHQRYDARLIQANASVLLIGEFHAADLAESRWRPLTAGLPAEAWCELMPDLGRATDGIAPFENPVGLTARADELVVRTAAETILLKNTGDELKLVETKAVAAVPTDGVATELSVGAFTIRRASDGSGDGGGSLVFGGTKP